MPTSKKTLASDLTSSGVVTHIQTHIEEQKALLARELHDELGGLLVGAMMDLAWVEQHLSSPAVDLKSKLVRARQTLSTAIDLKRRLIEELRPTLLDNVGLFAALRWHIHGACTLSGLVCDIDVPEEEARFAPETPIALFRIGQEALALVLSDHSTTAAGFTARMAPDLLTFDLMTAAALAPPASQLSEDSYPVATVRHRTAALGGKFEMAYKETGGIRVTASFPLA